MWVPTKVSFDNFKMVWDVLEAFGADEKDSVWIPYWRNPLSAYPEGAAVSSWERNGEKLLVVYNVAYSPVTVELPCDAEYYDTLREEKHPAVFELAGRSLRLLSVK